MIRILNNFDHNLKKISLHTHTHRTAAQLKRPASPHVALVVVQHQGRLHVVGQRAHLLLAEEVPQQREDALAQEAELGDEANTMRAASAHAGNEPPLVRHHEVSMASV